MFVLVLRRLTNFAIVGEAVGDDFFIFGDFGSNLVKDFCKTSIAIFYPKVYGLFGDASLDITISLFFSSSAYYFTFSTKSLVLRSSTGVGLCFSVDIRNIDFSLLS